MNSSGNLIPVWLKSLINFECIYTIHILSSFCAAICIYNKWRRRWELKLPSWFWLLFVLSKQAPEQKNDTILVHSPLPVEVRSRRGPFCPAGLPWPPLIVTRSSWLPANLFRSAHTQMNINATEEDDGHAPRIADASPNARSRFPRPSAWLLLQCREEDGCTESLLLQPSSRGTEKRMSFKWNQ